MKMNVAGQEINFDGNDSTSDSSAPTNALKAMKDIKFYFTINKKGEIGEVTGIDEVREKIADESAIENEMARASISNAFSEDNFKQNLSQTFDVYPDKPVKPGDSWTKKTAVNSNGLQMDMENTYTLAAVTGNTVALKVSSKLSSDSGTSSVAGVDMDISGSSEGTLNYDLPTGLPVSGNRNMKMDMLMKAQGQEIPMTMNINTQITGTKL